MSITGLTMRDAALGALARLRIRSRARSRPW